MIKTPNVEVDCPNCATKMEPAAAKTPGVKSVSIAFMTLKITVEFCDGADEKAVMKNVLKACRRIDSDCEIQL